MIDGDWLANTSQPSKCVHKLRCLRRQGLINYQVSFAYQPHTNEIHISTDDGRCMRPLLMVENNSVKLQPSDLSSEATFDSLRFRGVIEYLDAEEEENCLIAMDQSYLINTLSEYSHC
jgi:DNA-directed RNA polymerase subunit B'